MISVIILSKNEERNIKKCIESVKWCDEVIVIDDSSIDKTISIVKSFKNKKIFVFQRKLEENFSSQRNFGLSKAKGDWILFVDSDEVVSDALAYEISNVAHQLTDKDLIKFNGFYIKRKDFMWGKELKFGEIGNTKLLRLAKRDMGKWEGNVHEEWKIKGQVGILKNPIIHYPHKTISEFLREINLYTSIRAQDLMSQRIKIYWWSILVFPIGKFVVNYLFKKGFLDGERGLIFAITMSFHSFLVRGKLWVLSNRK